MDKIRIGLVGVGGIMNGAHIPQYAQCNDSEITAICDINPEALRSTGERLGLPEDRWFADYRQLMDSGLVDAVDIATPDAVHCEIAVAAVERGLPFSSEKPMGMSYRQVKEVCDAAKEAGLEGMVCFSWHYFPYLRLIRELISDGRLGEIYHIYIRCIKDSGLWEGRRLEWRFDGKQSASGVMGDLCSHMFDIARFLGNEFDSVCADAGIFIKERMELNSDRMAPVTTWDWCNALARMENGANATFQISRTTKYIGNWIQVELYGSKGRLFYSNDAVKGEELELQCGAEVEHPKPQERHRANQSQAYLNILRGNTDGLEATLENGCRCQAVLDAAFRSVAEGRWVSVREIMENP